MTGPNPFLTGLACRCPACGEGPLFDGFLKVRARCDACGQDLRAADSGDGPAVFIVLIVGMIACFCALMTEVLYHPPVWVHLVVWLPLTAILLLPVWGAIGLLVYFFYSRGHSHVGRGLTDAPDTTTPSIIDGP